MARRILFLTFFMTLACTACFGQDTYKGLTPGRSTRGEAERVLGKPVRTVSVTLLEYKPPVGDVGKLYVQYGDASSGARVERIELVCEMQPTAQRGCNVYLGKGDSDARSFPSESPIWAEAKLDARVASVSSSEEANSKMVSYFGSPDFIVSTRLDQKSGTEYRVGFYSRELYENVVPKSCTGLWYGVWETNRGRMTLTRDDSSNEAAGRTSHFLRGSFSTHGTVEGFFTFDLPPLRELNGEWKDATGGGTMELKMTNDGNTAFSGTWERTSGKGPREGKWEGRCVASD